MKSLCVWLLALLLPGACLVPAIGVAADSPPKQAAAPVVFSDAQAARMAGRVKQTLDPGKVVLNTEAHPIRSTWADH